MRLGEIPGKSDAGVVVDLGDVAEGSLKSQRLEVELVNGLSRRESPTTIMGGKSRIEQLSVLANWMSNRGLSEKACWYGIRYFARPLGGGQNDVSLSGEDQRDLWEMSLKQDSLVQWYTISSDSDERLLQWRADVGERLRLWDVEEDVELALHRVEEAGDVCEHPINHEIIIELLGGAEHTGRSQLIGVETNEMGRLVGEALKVLPGWGSENSYRLFLELLRRFGSIVPAEILIHKLSLNFGADPQDNLRHYISTLRKKLISKESGLQVSTKTGVGYGLMFMRDGE